MWHIVSSICHMVLIVRNIKDNEWSIWYGSNNIEKRKSFYGIIITHKINTKCISLLNKIFNFCILIDILFDVKWVTVNVISAWWFLLTTGKPWKTDNPPEPFTLANTKNNSLYNWKFANSHVKWCLVRIVPKILAIKTIHWLLINIIWCYLSFCCCLEISGRSCQVWYFRRIG